MYTIAKWALLVFVILLVIAAIIPDKWVYSKEELDKMESYKNNTNWSDSYNCKRQRMAERREQYMHDNHITEESLDRKLADYDKKKFEESFGKYWEADDYFDEMFDDMEV